MHKNIDIATWKLILIIRTILLKTLYKKWATLARDKENTILNMGNPSGAGLSEFYNLEKMIFGFNKI